MADLSVNVLFRLKDQLSGKFAQMSKQFDTFRKKMDITAAKMQKVGRTMSTHLTLPILGLGALAGRTAVKFDDSMRKVQAITKATGGEFTGLRDLAMKLGQDTKFTASQAAEGMTFLGMAGLNVNEVMSALPKTLQLAAAGGITLAEAADISTNVMTAMGKTTEDLTHINDVLASTATSTNTSILELAEGMKNVAGFASEVGISTEELSAQLGKMASGGEKGGIAGTLLRNAFQALLKPTAKMNKLFKQSGVDISNFVTSGGKIKDFNGLMEKLTKGGANASQIMQAFGERGGRAIISLMKTGGPNLKELTTQLVNSQGAAAKMAATMESGPGGVFRRLKSVVESLAIAMADVFLPVITRIIEIIIPVVRWFANLNKVVKGVALTVLFMAASIGPLLIGLSKIMVAMKALRAFMLIFNLTMSPIMLKWFLLAAAIMAVVFAINKLRKKEYRVHPSFQNEDAGEGINSPSNEFMKNQKGRFDPTSFDPNNLSQKQTTDINLNIQTDAGARASVVGKKDRGSGSNLETNVERGSTVGGF